MSIWDKLTDKIVNEIEQNNFEKNCLPVITFDRCIKWASDMKTEYPQSAGFVVSVKQNPDPRNENDKICVTIAILDANNQPITLDGTNGISTIIHGQTIDEKFIDTLNGRETIKYMFK